MNDSNPAYWYNPSEKLLAVDEIPSFHEDYDESLVYTSDDNLSYYFDSEVTDWNSDIDPEDYTENDNHNDVLELFNWTRARIADDDRIANDLKNN